MPRVGMHVVVSGWFWEQTNTGSGQYLHRLLPHLADLASPDGAERPGGGGPELKLTLLLARAPEKRLPRFLSDSQCRSVHAVVAPPPPLPRKLSKLFWEQVTVPLHVRGLRAGLLLVPYWAAPLWQPAPTVVTVHDLIPLLLPAYRGGWSGALYTRIVTASARRCACALTVSEAGRRDVLSHLKLPQTRVHAVHHGPNRAPLARAGEEEAPASGSGYVAGKYGLPRRYFLYLGGFDARKNVQAIIRAYKRYLEKGGDPSVKLVVGGALPHADTLFAPDPRRQARRLGVEDSVRFIGWVSEADKAQLYAGATAFLFPSVYEGFGMMLLEAMDAGTPVVTSSE